MAIVCGPLAPPAGAVTLVSPAGAPIGGMWRQWANAAQLPTVTGDLVLDVDDPQAPCPIACSAAPGSRRLTSAGAEQSDPSAPPETWVTTWRAQKWNLDSSWDTSSTIAT